MPTTLQKGDINMYSVRALKSLLATEGYDARADAPFKFGNATKAAVMQFQADHGLAASGTADNQTWLAILRVDSTAIAFNHGTMPNITSANAYTGGRDHTTVTIYVQNAVAEPDRCSNRAIDLSLGVNDTNIVWFAGTEAVFDYVTPGQHIYSVSSGCGGNAKTANESRNQYIVMNI